MKINLDSVEASMRLIRDAHTNKDLGELKKLLKTTHKLFTRILDNKVVGNKKNSYWDVVKYLDERIKQINQDKYNKMLGDNTND